MALHKDHIKNFQTLQTAFANGDVALVECKLKATGKPVTIICAVNRLGKEREFIPLASMFNNNPYKLLIPPETEENPSL